MSEDQYFLRIGDDLWINPFNGNITHAQKTKDFDGFGVIDLYFVNGERLRYRLDTPYARELVAWLNDESIDLEKRNEAQARIRHE